MSITGSLVVFVCLWWIIFFAILPIDVNREKKENIEGVDPGAPENPKNFKKNWLFYFDYINYIYNHLFISKI